MTKYKYVVKSFLPTASVAQDTGSIVDLAGLIPQEMLSAVRFYDAIDTNIAIELSIGNEYYEIIKV